MPIISQLHLQFLMSEMKTASPLIPSPRTGAILLLVTRLSARIRHNQHVTLPLFTHSHPQFPRKIAHNPSCWAPWATLCHFRFNFLRKRPPLRALNKFWGENLWPSPFLSKLTRTFLRFLNHFPQLSHVNITKNSQYLRWMRTNANNFGYFDGIVQKWGKLLIFLLQSAEFAPHWSLCTTWSGCFIWKWQLVHCES